MQPFYFMASSLTKKLNIDYTLHLLTQSLFVFNLWKKYPIIYQPTFHLKSFVAIHLFLKFH